MTTIDVSGEIVYPDDSVRDLSHRERPIVSVISIVRPGWVFLSSGVTTRSERVEVVL